MKKLPHLALGLLLTASTAFAGEYDFGDTLGVIDKSTAGSTQTISDAITGTAGVTIAAIGNMSDTGSGNGNRIILSGDNSGLTGDVTITAGYVELSGTDAQFANASKFILDGGGLIGNASADYPLAISVHVTDNGGYLRAFSGLNAYNKALVVSDLTGTGLLTKTDTGYLRLTGDLRGFTGSLRLGAGRVVIASDAGRDLVLKRLEVGSGTLQIYSNKTVTVTEGIHGTTNLTKTDGGHITVSGDSTISGTLTYGGSDSYDSVLQVGIGGTTGTLGTGNVVMNHARAILRLNRADGYDVTNNISGSGKIEVRGGGTFTLSGNNSITGGITIESGSTLIAASATALGAGAVTVNSGTSLVVDAAVTGVTNLTSAGTIVFADTDASINVSGTLNLAGATLDLTAYGANAASYELDIGALFGNATYDYESALAGITGLTGFTWGADGKTINIPAIPEPSTYALGAAGLLGAFVLLRRRRK